MLAQLRNVLDRMRQGHTHPVNKLLHAIGIPMILSSGPLMPINPALAGTLFVLGWTLLFVGHAIEGKLPVFLQLIRELVWSRVTEGAAAAAAHPHAMPN
jgi:uncharacterized membrane protein YGL010W